MYIFCKKKSYSLFFRKYIIIRYINIAFMSFMLNWILYIDVLGYCIYDMVGPTNFSDSRKKVNKLCYH